MSITLYELNGVLVTAKDFFLACDQGLVPGYTPERKYYCD